MPTPPRKAVPSLSELTGKSSASKSEDKDKEVKTSQAPRISDSGGLDNSNSDNKSSEIVTHDITVINKTQFDNSGNAVTDNYPNDYDETLSETARKQVNLPGEAATVMGTSYATVYADPAEVDDKGFAQHAKQVNDVNDDSSSK